MWFEIASSPFRFFHFRRFLVKACDSLVSRIYLALPFIETVNKNPGLQFYLKIHQVIDLIFFLLLYIILSDFIDVM